MHKDTVMKLQKGETDVKLLVYECHLSTSFCGGLGDRFSGMISLFYASVVLGRAFVIDQSMPLPLNITVVPNSDINWDVSGMISPSYSSSSVKLIDKYDVTKISKVFDADTNESDVIRVSMNRFFTGMALWSSFECKSSWFFGSMHRKNIACEHMINLQKPGDTFALAFNLLFRPSIEVGSRISELRASLSLDAPEINAEKFVAIHARLGGKVQRTSATTSWEDPIRDSLTDGKQFLQCASERELTLSPSTPGDPLPLVVFSDTEEFKKLIAQEDPRVRYSRDTHLFHIDRSKANFTTTVRGSIDATAEFFLLSQARCIVASYSTFSGAASSLLGFREGKPCFAHFKSCSSDDVDFWEQTEISFDFKKCDKG